MNLALMHYLPSFNGKLLVFSCHRTSLVSFKLFCFVDLFHNKVVLNSCIFLAKQCKDLGKVLNMITNNYNIFFLMLYIQFSALFDILSWHCFIFCIMRLNTVSSPNSNSEMASLINVL